MNKINPAAKVKIQCLPINIKPTNNIKLSRIIWSNGNKSIELNKSTSDKITMFLDKILFCTSWCIFNRYPEIIANKGRTVPSVKILIKLNTCKSSPKKYSNGLTSFKGNIKYKPL